MSPTCSRSAAMTVRRLSCLVLAGALAACASGGVTRVTDPSQPRLVGEGTPVTVSWGDPAQFTEVRYSTNPTLASAHAAPPSPPAPATPAAGRAVGRLHPAEAAADLEAALRATKRALPG